MKKAIQDADEAIGIDHSGLAGRIREILLTKLLEPVLPPEVKCGTGKLTDMKGALSKEIDVVLYSRQILPPTLYDEKNGIFPVESSLYTIEVKTTVSSKNLKEAIENAKSTKLKLLEAEYWNAKEGTVAENIFPINALFGFSSDLSGKGKTELDRYRELDRMADDFPAIQVFCVKGQGYWYFVGGEEKIWKYGSPTSEFDEILDFLSGITNTIPQLLSAKGRPRLGHYLSLEGRNFDDV